MTTPPGVDPVLAQQVYDAYARYWQARVQAQQDLSTQDLERVMAGAELARARIVIAQRQEEKRAYRAHVDHQAQPKYITADEAEIVDHYISTSLKLDPETHEPTSDAPIVEDRTDTFLLQKIDGAWKVVDEPDDGS